MMDIPIYLYLLYGEYFYFSSMTLGFLHASAVCTTLILFMCCILILWALKYHKGEQC